MIEVYNQCQNFNDEIMPGNDVITSLYGKKLILKNVYYYEGPITMQYLPYGGIQSTFGYNLIINTKSGYVTCDELIYNDTLYSTSDFVKKYSNLVNLILPN